jgi:hypothetical protein
LQSQPADLKSDESGTPAAPMPAIIRIITGSDDEAMLGLDRLTGRSAGSLKNSASSGDIK